MGTSVHRKISYVLGVAALGAMVASCGGSNSPTPTPTETPTPTPTPTSTATPTPIDFAQDFIQTSTRVYIYANFTPTGGTAVFSDAARVSGTGAVSYTVSPEEVLYAFPNLAPSASFVGTDLVDASATMRSYANGDESLLMEKPYSHTLRVSYLRNDSFVSGTEPGILRSARVTVFGNEITTTDAVAAMLSYTGQTQVVGGTPGTTAANIAVANDSTFTVTPTDTVPDIAGTINIFENVGGTMTQKAALVFEGTAGANGTFTGDITDDTYDFEGAFSGSMAGPNREEIYLVFSATHEDGRRYVGSYLGN